jgi:hypothetical protein
MPHWHPRDDKQFLIDDLNDFIKRAGGTPIDYSTRMTITEINNLIYALAQLTRGTRSNGAALAAQCVLSSLAEALAAGLKKTDEGHLETEPQS